MESMGGKIVIVDDKEEGRGLASILTSKGLEAVVRHPENLEHRDLSDADVVLVDYELNDWTDLGEVAAAPLARKPVDGIALTAVLQRHLHSKHDSRPAAFAIHTGKIERFASPIPYTNREHLLARASNLEWVFRKTEAGKSVHLADAVASLAAAVRQLPQTWPDAGDTGAMDTLMSSLLNISAEHPRRAQLLDAVVSCNPPVHELSQWSHGLAALRWLLHRVLPYPTFLWSVPYVASRLRVTQRWLRANLVEGKPLWEHMRNSHYSGVLAGFLGARWWRSEVESLVWRETNGSSFDNVAVWNWLQRAAGEEPESTDVPAQPVVCVNTDYEPLEAFGEIRRCVRLIPDDWPSYADSAWVTIERAVEEPKLLSVVHQEDRGRIDD